MSNPSSTLLALDWALLAVWLFCKCGVYLQEPTQLLFLIFKNKIIINFSLAINSRETGYSKIVEKQLKKALPSGLIMALWETSSSRADASQCQYRVSEFVTCTTDCL